MIVPDTQIDVDTYLSYDDKGHDGYVYLDIEWTDFCFNCSLSPKQTKLLIVKLQTCLAQLETKYE